MRNKRYRVLKKSNKRNKMIIISVVTIFIVSAILYMLAYRYIVERVETKAVSNTVQATETSFSSSNVVMDDMSYTSDSISISINKVQQGEGQDKVTYFVVDVQLKYASSLKSAFAKDEFGRNITETTSTMAENNNAIFAINGDYYGFRGDGIEIRNGVLYRDDPARVGAAIYNDGTLKCYDETETTGEELLEAGVINTLSFGPQLVKDGEAITDFTNVKIDTNMGNSSIQDLNPRTGIGMISPNHFVFVVVDGRSENYSKGMTLNDFAELFESLGCTEAYNLDGGGSSTMYFNGKVINNPSNRGGERAVSDILYIN